MSETTPNDLRFMRRNSLEQERKIFENYFHDLIYNYGLDTEYFRQDTKYPEKWDLTPTLSGLEDLIYGENANTTYYLSGDMIIYVEIENDIFELNKWALMPNENISLYFTVNDFSTKFASQLGSKKNFADTIEFTGTHTGTGTLEISGAFIANDILSGIISTSIPASSTGSVEVSSFSVDIDTDVGYKIPINEHIAISNNYTVSGGEYTGASYGTITMGLTSYTCEAVVGVLYYEPTSPNQFNTTIMPQVGDFFRMPFFDGNYEEYEITNIADRVLTTDGINPLLGKYIWKCSAVRRAPSFEDVIGEDQMESNAMQNIQNLQANAIENIADTINDYSNNDDDVYGGYGDTGDYLTSPPIDVSNYDVSGVVFEFDYGPSYILSDGKNLYFRNENDITTLLSDDSRVSETIPETFAGLGYMRTDGEDLFFVNNDETSWQLTSNFKQDPYVQSIIDVSNMVPSDWNESTILADSTFDTWTTSSNGYIYNTNWRLIYTDELPEGTFYPYASADTITKDDNGIRLIFTPRSPPTGITTGHRNYLIARGGGTDNITMEAGRRYQYEIDIHSLSGEPLRLMVGGSITIDVLPTSGIYTGQFTPNSRGNAFISQGGDKETGLDCVISSYQIWDVTDLHGIYYTLNQNLYLFSDGINLFVINQDGESTQITFN
jgi:hypothetical protein